MRYPLIIQRPIARFDGKDKVDAVSMNLSNSLDGSVSSYTAILYFVCWYQRIEAWTGIFLRKGIYRVILFFPFLLFEGSVSLTRIV